jgi:hypothetical protein
MFLVIPKTVIFSNHFIKYGGIRMVKSYMALDNTNRQKVSYYERFLELPDNRLCKSVFNEMVRKGDSFWNYKEHVFSLINQPDVNVGISMDRAI